MENKVCLKLFKHFVYLVIAVIKFICLLKFYFMSDIEMYFFVCFSLTITKRLVILKFIFNVAVKKKKKN